jgi:hypothetical protein
MKLPSMNLAAAASFHSDPQAKQDPRNQRNNTMNMAGMLGPQELAYSNPYGDSTVPLQQPGITVNPAAQQRVILRPGSKNTPGLPGLMLSADQLAMADQLALNTTQLPMGQSQVGGGAPPDVALRRGIGTTETDGTRRPQGRSTGFRWSNSKSV